MMIFMAIWWIEKTARNKNSFMASNVFETTEKERVSELVKKGC